MKLAIMQPYFLPYIGYFQLISSVDKFVIYDNIKYTKSGWISRNRILNNGSAKIISLSLEKDSDYRFVVDRQLSSNFDRRKLINSITDSYRRAPYYRETINLIEDLLYFESRNLFNFIYNSIIKLCFHLGIETEFVISSEVSPSNALKGEERVISICKKLSAKFYINSEGGVELYSHTTFKNHGIILKFLRPNTFVYNQFGDPFVEKLSIIDVLMFVPRDQIRKQILFGYEFFD